MSVPRSSPIDAGPSPGGRRHSVLSDFIPSSLPLPPSFIATAPNVQEILSRDIADCSSSDENEDTEAHADIDDSDSRSLYHNEAQLAFHANGYSYGSGYSTVPLPGVDHPVPNPHEVDDSLHAQLSLLRDNDLLPPKYSKRWRVPVLGRLYRSLANRWLPSHDKPRRYSETAPLLPDLDEDSEDGLPSPPAEEVHTLWEEALAAHDIKTTWQREAKTLVGYSAPLIATFLLHYSVTVGSVLTVGRLGMEELAAVNCKYIQSPLTDISIQLKPSTSRLTSTQWRL